MRLTRQQCSFLVDVPFWLEICLSRRASKNLPLEGPKTLSFKGISIWILSFLTESNKRNKNWFTWKENEHFWRYRYLQQLSDRFFSTPAETPLTKFEGLVSPSDKFFSIKSTLRCVNFHSDRSTIVGVFERHKYIHTKHFPLLLLFVVQILT